jgi:uncharacterized protein YeaO (DUF488 family)
MNALPEVQIKRAYEPASPSDGYRVLVDRLWPRGVSKEEAHLDLWLKDVAPSTGLRESWNHNPDTFSQFKTAYRKELSHNPAVTELEKIIAEHRHVTLIYAAHDPLVNHALVLQDYLLNHLK